MPLPTGTSVTVQVKVSVASTVGPSRTVIDTLYGLPAAAAELMVPVMRPVEVLIERPGGGWWPRTSTGRRRDRSPRRRG
jgi:hypothetical protein